MNKAAIMQKCEKLSDKGSFSYRVCKALKDGDFNDISSSKQLAQVLNDGPGKKIKVSDLTALMQPLLKEDIVKVKSIKSGKDRGKYWFPGWLDKKFVKANITTKTEKMDYFKLLNIHPEIQRVSKKLFLDGHYAQAIFEAFKRINNIVKEKSGKLELDGKDLMFHVFSVDRPVLKFNRLITESERNEQEGFMHILAGSMQGIRNPKAHDTIIQRDRSRTLECLVLASLLCKKIAETYRAIPTRKDLHKIVGAE